MAINGDDNDPTRAPADAKAVKIRKMGEITILKKIVKLK